MAFFLPLGGWTMPPIPPFRGTRNNQRKKQIHQTTLLFLHFFCTPSGSMKKFRAFYKVRPEPIVRSGGTWGPYKWSYKWVTGVLTPKSGVITPFITRRGPTLFKFTKIVLWIYRNLVLCFSFQGLYEFFVVVIFSGLPGYMYLATSG